MTRNIYKKNYSNENEKSYISEIPIILNKMYFLLVS